MQKKPSRKTISFTSFAFSRQTRQYSTILQISVGIYKCRAYTYETKQIKYLFGGMFLGEQVAASKLETHKPSQRNKYQQREKNYLNQYSANMERSPQLNLPLVQNVVSFAKMNIQNDLDLKLIAEKIQGCRYNKKRFPAVIMRKTKPKSTILIFKSGRMIIIGSQSQTDAEQAAIKSIKDIKKTLQIKLKMVDFRITNIVAKAELGCRIDIGKLCQQKNVIRNENFPGVVYKQINHVKSALIFASGKVVFTGAKTKDSIDNAFTELKKKMQKFKKITT